MISGIGLPRLDVQFSMTFSNIFGRISAITWRMFSPNGQAFVSYPHRPMTLHSPTKNSLAVLNYKILESNSQVQNVKLGGHQTCLSINRLWLELCDMLHHLVGTKLLAIMIVQFRNDKVSNHGSIPITIDCNVVAFIAFEEGFHQPIKRTKQSVFLDVTVFRHTLVD
ncbi:hypothetical protein TNCV_4237591 [Trichonephila clavipes]|nr:hypothetical protein TNCV_4237591 [Trichonephila clavipes]